MNSFTRLFFLVVEEMWLWEGDANISGNQWICLVLSKIFKAIFLLKMGRCALQHTIWFCQEI